MRGVSGRARWCDSHGWEHILSSCLFRHIGTLSVSVSPALLSRVTLTVAMPFLNEIQLSSENWADELEGSLQQIIHNPLPNTLHSIELYQIPDSVAQQIVSAFVTHLHSHSSLRSVSLNFSKRNIPSDISFAAIGRVTELRITRSEWETSLSNSQLREIRLSLSGLWLVSLPIKRGSVHSILEMLRIPGPPLSWTEIPFGLDCLCDESAALLPSVLPHIR